jgi:hypothetical protein
MTTIFIRNNSYMRRLEIKINGNSPSSYSRLNGIMNEPFLFWIKQIISLLHEEINYDDYRLTFESREEELEILEKLVEDDSKCVMFTKKKPVRDLPLNNRMARFSSFLKENGIKIKKFAIPVLFVIPDDRKDLKNELEEMHIENSYCILIPKVTLNSEYKFNRETSDNIFFIYDNEEQYDNSIKVDGCFTIILSNKNAFFGFENSSLVYLTTKDTFFETLFKCFMIGVLEDVLYKGIVSVPEHIKEKYTEVFDEIVGTAPRVYLDAVSSIIETGSSVDIKIFNEEDVVSQSDFTFECRPKGFIECDGKKIRGLRDGKATLYAYRKGDREPCIAKEFKVITRNRVKELSVEDEDVFIGEGDNFKINWSYMPLDADNIKCLTWSSENTDIAKVSNSGQVYGMQQGDTIIKISCEKVSKNIYIHVLPHIKSIKVNPDEIVLLPQDKISVSITSVPSPCIEGKLLCSIMDARVANFVNGCVVAFAVGETTLIIQDSAEHMRREIPVRVVTLKEWNKIHGIKKGFFAKLFGN